jgi:hypothetical protein
LSGPPPAVTSDSHPESFLVVLNGTGSAAVTSGYLSGLNSYEQASGPVTADFPAVAVDTLGNAWLAGALLGTPDFPVTTTAAPGPTGAWLAEVSMANTGNVIPVPLSVDFGTYVPVNVSSTAYFVASTNPDDNCPSQYGQRSGDVEFDHRQPLDLHRDRQLRRPDCRSQLLHREFGLYAGNRRAGHWHTDDYFEWVEQPAGGAAERPGRGQPASSWRPPRR